MTTPIPVVPADVTDLPELAERQTLRTLGLRGLFLSLPFVGLALAVLWGASGAIFVAVQVQRIDPANKVGSLALVIGIGAVVAMLTAPIVGTLSDRTRTRLGGRLPWMIAGALLTIVFAVLIGTASSLALIVVFFAGIQVSTNLINTPVTAFVPSRVPAIRRGAFSAAIGLSSLVGAAIGQIAGALFADSIAVGYLGLSILLVVAVGIFTLVNRRGEDNRSVPKPPLEVKAVLSTFWVNPVKYPEFAWAFAGRFLLFTGYFLVSAYSLYIIQDYIGLGDDAVSLVPVVGIVGLLGMIITTPIAGALSDKLGRRKIFVVVSTLILAVGLLIPVFVPSVAGMVVYAFVSGMGFGAYQSVDFALVTQVLPSDKNFGKDLGIINITTSLPQTIAAAIAGIVVTVFAGYMALFIAAAVIAVLGAVALLPIKSVR